MPQRNWAKDEVNLDYLLDSGLLFKINQTVLHLVGIAMSIKVNRETGEKQLSFVDKRDAPEELIFPESVFESSEAKYQGFREEFGGKQISRRQSKLGIGCQNYPTIGRKS